MPSGEALGATGSLQPTGSPPLMPPLQHVRNITFPVKYQCTWNQVPVDGDGAMAYVCVAASPVICRRGLCRRRRRQPGGQVVASLLASRRMLRAGRARAGAAATAAPAMPVLRQPPYWRRGGLHAGVYFLPAEPTVMAVAGGPPPLAQPSVDSVAQVGARRLTQAWQGMRPQQARHLRTQQKAIVINMCGKLLGHHHCHRCAILPPLMTRWPSYLRPDTNRHVSQMALSARARGQTTRPQGLGPDAMPDKHTTIACLDWEYDGKG